MSLLLHIETATEICSVALSKNGKLLSILEEQESYKHSAVLTVLIEQLLLKKSISITDLDAVSVSSGPGSYTGLRIGVSCAKGICYGLNIPLISISTLHAIASGLSALKEQDSILCPILKSRKNELYFASYDENTVELNKPQPILISEFIIWISEQKEKILIGGNGISTIRNSLDKFDNIKFTDVYSSSQHMINISHSMYCANDFVDLAYFEPQYLKGFIKS